ncbi:MAG: hypothetical protein H7Y22_12925, partial [Gemmatimonadaceae bacterium]|nr:hypothetical protein [Gloeobacterales cyanobacterium ES-bin-141]
PYLIDGKSIKIHQQWADYFQKHYLIVRSWASWEWLRYMQRYNPNVPAIANKLFAPRERASLADQKKYCRVITENAPVHCVFSRERIAERAPPLDHYLPWSFVAHDHLWNLIPTLQHVNFSKSNNFPDSSYHQDFIALQHLGLTTSYQHMPEHTWRKYTEPYMLDLKVSNKDDLLSLEVITNAYQPVLESLSALAKGQGFASNWIYKCLSRNT